MADANARSHDTVLEVDDLDALQLTVDPWQVEMQQLTPGKLRARERFAPVKSILVTLEHWNQRMLTRGSSPPGYLMVGGLFSATPVYFCKSQLGERRLGICLDGAEVAFVTPEGSQHWTVLIPIQNLQGRPGFERISQKAQPRTLPCSDQHHNRLRRLVSLALNCGINSDWLTEGHPLLDILECEICDTVAQLLNGEGPGEPTARQSAHWEHTIKAIAVSEQRRFDLTPETLAMTSGVSARVLQQSFRDIVGISPNRFLRNARLHEVRKLLVGRTHPEMTVTEAMTRWGFKELGRAAVEYGKLFNERPSATLARLSEPSPASFSGAMRPGA